VIIRLFHNQRKPLQLSHRHGGRGGHRQVTSEFVGPRGNNRLKRTSNLGASRVKHQVTSFSCLALTEVVENVVPSSGVP